mmetsp:Transcript_25022/g.36947  ORF Transcript_25022/g.36947 Transcript_25022/m.36947 type:complete len:157 (+) Transcript_25022:58-528(+)
MSPASEICSSTFSSSIIDDENEMATWRGVRHWRCRLDMRRYIEQILVARSNSSKRTIHKGKFPQMARRLEQILYVKADSFEEYINLQTLCSRLVSIASSHWSSGCSQNRPAESEFFQVPVGTMLSKRRCSVEDDVVESMSKRCNISSTENTSEVLA